MFCLVGFLSGELSSRGVGTLVVEKLGRISYQLLFKSQRRLTNFGEKKRKKKLAQQDSVLLVYILS